MMKLMKTSLCALAVLTATSFAVQAAGPSVDLAITGKIAPPSCVPTITGGNIDYGTISSNILSPTAYTILPKKETTFQIECQGLSRVAFTVKDNKSGSAAGGKTPAANGFAILPVKLFGSDTAWGGGLGYGGTSNDKKTGGVSMRALAAIASVDGKKAVSAVYSIDKGANWYNNMTDSVITGTASAPYYLSFSTDSTSLPTPFTKMDFVIDVAGYINKSSELDLTNEVNIDGLMTFELVYP